MTPISPHFSSKHAANGYALISVAEAKLSPPADTTTQLQRSAIRDTICDAAVKLVLVRAPAGFGKTTAMKQSFTRLEERGIATAWLTLDTADNDVSRFLACLTRAASGLGLETDANAPLDVVQALAAHELPFALFLDEFESVREPAVLGLIREIIDHLPRRGQLVIGSRSLPALGLGRLRARGQLAEIDAEHLRFSLEDTGAFFALRRRGKLPDAQLQQLHRKTEGWIAALWLASMALERHGNEADFIERFSGTDRAIAEYLAEDVVAHQPAEIRDFLLRTSILRQLDADVCQALDPRADCVRLLDQLDAANLFLTPIATEERAWRYHSLFADYLRAQLTREQPDEVARLHLAASGWYELQGRAVPSIDHAIDGGDHPHALALLHQHGRQFLEQGRMRLLARWFVAIPASQLRKHTQLEVMSLWAASFTRGPWEALDQLAHSACVDSDDDDVQGQLGALRPLLLAMQDRYDEALDAGRLSLLRPYTHNQFAANVLRNAMANILSVMGDHDEAQRLLDAASREQGHGTFNRMYSASMEGLLDLHQGRMRQATARFRIAVDATHASTYGHTHGNAWAGVLYASAVYEANQLELVERLLNVYLPLARDVGLPDHMILSHVMRSRIAFIAGDVDGAALVLTELEYVGHTRQLPRVVAAARLERSRVLLLQGNGIAAGEELRRADDRSVWDREQRQRLPAHDLDYFELAQLRWQLTFGNAHEAVLSLEREMSTATRHGLNRRVLKLKLLRALALQRTGATLSAASAMGDVLMETSREGFMRIVLDEGPAVSAVLRGFEAMANNRGGADVDPLLAEPILLEHLQRLIHAAGPPVSEPEVVHNVLTAVADPLTRKELRVLQLLAEGYSNGAMAEKLFVSDSTVRTHLRSINMKVGANSRTQAVALARKLGVIR